MPMPHQGQQAILKSDARFKWVAAGRRWRKTTLALHPAIESVLHKQHVLWAAPTFDQSRVGWGELYHAAGDVAEFHLGRMQVDFPSGGRVTFRSLDNPDNARGYTADGIIIDEAARVKAAAWYEVLRPIISDTGGWGLMLGTPNGRNWFWREWQAARDDPDAEAWEIPTVGCVIKDGELIRKLHPLENSAFSFSEIQRMWRTMPERIFRQEILAEFIDDTGGVFRGVRACATAQEQRESIGGHSYVFGVDWGKSNDFTVITVLDATLRQAVAKDRFNQIDYVLQRARLEALYERFRPEQIIAERNSMGEPIIEQLQRDGLPVVPFTTTNASKAQAIEALALAIEKQDIAIIPDEVMIAELQAYEARRLPSGTLRYTAPEGMHDDCVMSLAIAWQGIAPANARAALMVFDDRVEISPV